MFDTEAVDAILKGIVRLNTEMEPFAVLLPVLFAVVVIVLLANCYRSPGRGSSTALTASIAAVYVFGGWTIFNGRAEMGLTNSLTGAVALWAVALLLLIDAVFHWTEVRWPKRLDLQILSVTFMVAGMFLYPFLEMALGFSWPRMVLFGAECPTTIFLIGLFIGAVPRVNKPLFVIVSVNAIATGLSVALHGAPFDFLYAAAGVAGVTMIISHFREIFGKNVSDSATGRDTSL